ncbi:Putative ribonuclease H protein [Dendrobium catenatum]|uniref:Ribonuclease H protein n=1 Tax=Dendrobium catenatum TaxID=906689 RepID=A0A2I0X6A7_9ASPA|nr:Putative ribonuclease H protein [Dendrobium catenatum]
MADQNLIAQEVFNKFRHSKAKKGLVAIKVDMEQAYDSMCWSTLEKVMEWFGLPKIFSKLILECVVNPKISILINAGSIKWIGAHCGFRQVCSLSPFLFIICSQLLTEEFGHLGKRIGVKVSHLMYADDILIFSKANKKCLKKVDKILKNYCSWTGQKVNLPKLAALFSKNVKKTECRSLLKVINMKMVKEMKYLGIKIDLRRLVKSDFNKLVVKTAARMNLWGTKFISLAGKITLINASVLSLPTYLSSHSLIPLGVLYDMERMCRDFIWNKRDGSYGMHYVSWSSLCKPKNKGGYGLQSLVEKLGPLRAKFALNFITKSNSLLNRILRAKYGNDLWNDANRNYYSSTWKLIQKGAESLFPVLRWKIADGKRVDTFKDIWILDKSIDKWPTFV